MYKTTMGLEIHIELKTKEKLFCSCKTNFDAKENENTCPICLGRAGVLPKFNREVLPLVIKLGIALNSDIHNHISFDRKHYFYRDLPKGFQTTQFYKPILQNGYLELENKIINVKEVHIEEDAGKSKNNIVNFNRAGICLLEIVTKPDFENYEEVIEFLKRLREILLFLDISDAKIEEGSMRVDINISISNDNKLGNRVEIKNLGSFKSIKNAILYEEKRQIKELSKGNPIEEHTRRFDENQNKTIFSRKKETIKDYKYIREFDINSFILDDDFIDNIRKSIKELPKDKRKRYQEKYNLTKNEIDIVLDNPDICNIFENLVYMTNNVREVVNLICGEFLKIVNKEKIDIKKINLKYIANLVDIFLDAKITRNSYKKALYEIIINNENPKDYIDNNNLWLITDTEIIERAINLAIKENNKALEDYKNGKDKSIKYILGVALKNLDYKADANIVNNFLIDILKNM